jgi:hypothetical protein
VAFYDGNFQEGWLRQRKSMIFDAGRLCHLGISPEWRRRKKLEGRSVRREKQEADVIGSGLRHSFEMDPADCETAPSTPVDTKFDYVSSFRGKFEKPQL